MSSEENELNITLLKCLSEQLNEMELFKSMYPNDDEMVFLHSDIIERITDYINNKTVYVPQHLDFTLLMKINNNKLEICINLPSFYPIEEPDIYIRCNQLNRQQQTCLNSELLSFIKTIHNGEVCLFTITSWIQEHVEEFTSVQTNLNNEVQDIEDNVQDNDNFVRLWIFSHHIYNKKKRDEIVNLAKELNLSGFCLPGKPGIICIEGFESSCKEWWKVIKSLNWQKIVVRKTEIFNLSERQKHQKFHNFEEIHFHNTSLKDGKHADMSEFSKYVELHGLSHAFNEIFGLNCLSK